MLSQLSPSMNPILVLFLISILSKARTRRDRLKATLVILAVLSQQQGHTKLANLRRMVCNTSEHSMLIILATAVLHNICTTFNDLERFYFDGSDGSRHKFPPSPIKLYNERYPLGKIVCPRCKKQSNGAMTSKDGCPCLLSRL